MCTSPESTSFDRVAKRYDQFAALTGGGLADYLAERLPASNGGRAVDLGCGTGYRAAFLAARYDTVLAVDNNQLMLDSAQRRHNLPNIRYELRDLNDVTTQADGQFNLVLSSYTLHHVTDLTRVLPGLRALVAPGGMAILVDVVDERGYQRSQARFVRAALGTFAGDLRDRGPGAAWWLLRFNLARDWRAHVTADPLQDPADHARTYRAALPGAAVTPVDVHPLYQARAVCYRAGRSAEDAG